MVIEQQMNRGRTADGIAKKGSRKEKAEKKLKQLGEGKSWCFAKRKKKEVFFREVVKVN